MKKIELSPRAIELLEMEIQRIQDDKSKFDIQDWISTETEIGYYSPQNVKKALNHCGTTACIAGGIYSNLTEEEGVINVNHVHFSDLVDKALGLDSKQAATLFYGGCWPEPFASQFINAETKDAEAEVAIRRIRHLINNGE